MPSKDTLHTSRRAVLKKSATAVAASVGVVGATASASASKDHTVRAKFTGIYGGGEYRIEVPDPRVEGVNHEPKDGDDIDRRNNSAVINGKVSAFGGNKDKYKFNGDADDVEHSSDDHVDIEIW